jgi:hypothetical protein
MHRQTRWSQFRSASTFAGGALLHVMDRIHQALAWRFGQNAGLFGYAISLALLGGNAFGFFARGFFRSRFFGCLDTCSFTDSLFRSFTGGAGIGHGLAFGTQAGDGRIIFSRSRFEPLEHLGLGVL